MLNQIEIRPIDLEKINMLKGLWQQRRQTRDKFWTGHEFIKLSWIRYYTFNRTPRSKLYSRLFFFKLYSYSRVQNSIFFFSYGAYRKQLIYLKCSVLNKIVTYRSVNMIYSIISIYINIQFFLYFLRKLFVFSSVVNWQESTRFSEIMS